jgi:hypothetical protein
MALSIKDALRLAAKDPHFATELVSNPNSLKAQFNLSDTQVAHLESLGTAAATARGGLVGSGIGADYD